MATHSRTFAWKIPWMEEPGRLQSMGSLTVGHDWATSLSLFTFMHWRRKRQPTPVFLPGESQRRRAWWAAVYGVAQSRTRLKRLSSSNSTCMSLATLECWPASYWGCFNLFVFRTQQSGLSYPQLIWVLTADFSAYEWTLYMHVCMVSLSVMSESLWPHGLQPCSSLCPWDFPGNYTGVGFHCLL